MKNYKTKSKLFGYQIGLNNDNLYVAVPAKYFANGESVNIQVVEDTSIPVYTRLVTIDDKEQEVTLKDKYKPNQDYKIYYFLIKEYTI